MSQEKVDAYKKEKANRKKVLKTQKTKALVYRILGGVAGVLVIGWIVWSVVDSSIEKPRVFTEKELSSMRDVINAVGLGDATTASKENATTGKDESTTTKDESTTAESETTTGESETTTGESETTAATE